MHFPLSPEGHENIVCHGEGIFRELRLKDSAEYFSPGGEAHRKVSAPLRLRSVNAEWRAAQKLRTIQT